MDSDEYSDLTALESDDEYGAPKSRKGAKKGPPGTGYRIRNALKVPRATTYTAQALYDQIHNSDVDLEPEYQRAVVWPESKQIGIIDSIFRNFYIPPVIFAVKQYEDGSESKTCIDGKQRLTSIHRFMDGLIPHKDPHTGEKLWYKNADVPVKGSAKARKILPETYRRLFANKQIVCVEYQDITDNDEREIFQRVQLGMALTPAEKLQVINTPRASFVRDLLSEFVNDSNSLGSDALEWDRGRGADFRCVAQSVFCIVRYPMGIRNAGTMPQLEKWLSAPDPLSTATMDMVKETYRLFVQLVSDKALNKVFHKPAKIAPLEFICIPILIAMKGSKMTPAQLAATIGRMRDEVRRVHVDIRMNDRVSKTILDFIASIKAPTAVVPDQASAASVGQKRKRTKDEDSASEGGPKTQKPKPKASPVKKTSSSSPAPLNPASSSSQVSGSQAKPGVDRMAALRTAKSMVQQRASAASSSGAPSSSSSAAAAGALTSVPLAPRPGLPPSTAGPSTSTSTSTAANTALSLNTTPSVHPLPRRPRSTPLVESPTLGNGLEAQLMASMNRIGAGGERPPPSTSSSQGYRYGPAPGPGGGAGAGAGGGAGAGRGGTPNGDDRGHDSRIRPKGR